MVPRRIGAGSRDRSTYSRSIYLSSMSQPSKLNKSLVSATNSTAQVGAGSDNRSIDLPPNSTGALRQAVAALHGCLLAIRLYLYTVPLCDTTVGIYYRCLPYNSESVLMDLIDHYYRVLSRRFALDWLLGRRQLQRRPEREGLIDRSSSESDR